LSSGDISYASGYLSMWDEFHDQIAPIASRVPWQVAIGNHERVSALGLGRFLYAAPTLWSA
jgi:hypothetical protein